MDRLTREEIAGAVARGYCTTANMHKELDADLVTGITNEVMALQSLSQEAVRDEASRALLDAICAARDEGFQQGLEKAAKVCEVYFEEPDWAWGERQLGNRFASAIRALKREPNAAATALEGWQKAIREELTPAPAAPVAEMVRRLRKHCEMIGHSSSGHETALHTRNADAAEAALLEKLGQEQSPFVVNWTTEGCPKHHGQPWSFTASVYTEIAKRCPLCEPLPGASDE